MSHSSQRQQTSNRWERKARWITSEGAAIHFPGLEDCALQYIRAEPCLRLTNMNDHNLHSHLGSLPLIVRPPTVSLT